MWLILAVEPYCFALKLYKCKIQGKLTLTKNVIPKVR